MCLICTNIVAENVKTLTTLGNEGFSAEMEGFEPPVRCRTTVFKTAAFDHSATSPLQK